MKIIRILVQIKPRVFSIIRKTSNPFLGIWRFFVGAVVVPIYRLIYIVRKQLSRVYRPAKNKLMLLVTNRYAIHVVIATIAIITGIVNFQINEVRAESFGQKSSLYKMVSVQDEVIEEHAGDISSIEYASVGYRDKTALASMSRGMTFVTSDDYAVSFVSGRSIFAPTISESDESVAPRENIEVYVIEQGDTISTIAAKFGISVNTLLWANNLSVRSLIKPGDELSILPVSGIKHIVAKNETLSSIAKKYEVEQEEVLEFNKLASANDLVVGEEIIVPGGVIVAPPPVRSSTSITQVFSQPTTPATSSTAQPTVAGTGSMVWPTDMRVITQYYGWRHNGLDVDCKFTNDNYAADNGIVSYAGWMGGYGYLVEINHGNGIVTRYGHHASLYVTAGQQVSAGQAIGLCGTTGKSTGTHLHFEVRVNGVPRNPLEYIR
ncbi:MAG: M23 family metallopeptidase [Patescibacteria group bacterium]